jgi:hypothetical protein
MRMETKRLVGTFLTFLVASLLWASNVQAQEWITVGERGFSEGGSYYQSIILIDDVPYVAYVDKVNDRRAAVQRFINGAWEYVGDTSISQGKAENLSIASLDGQPCIAFTDDSASGKGSVMKFNGTSWEYVGGQGFAGQGLTEIRLTTAGGTYWVVFNDNKNSDGKLSVMKFGNMGWEYVGNPGFSESTLDHLVRIQVDQGIPFVSFRDYNFNAYATVMSFNPTTKKWDYLGKRGFSGKTHDSYHNLAVRQGKPYVITWNEDYKATVYYYENAQWDTLGGDVLSSGTARYETIKFDDAGNLYAIFTDDGHGGRAYLYKYDGSQWSQVGDSITKYRVTFTDVALTSGGIPYVVYQDKSFREKTTVVKFDIPANIEEYSHSGSFQVFPNPATDRLNIKLPIDPLEKGITVRITNNLGQELLNKKINTAAVEIPIQHFSNGVYYIQVSYNNGTQGCRTFIKR